MAFEAPKIEMTIEGDRELKRLFQELPARLVEKGLRQAARAAGAIVRRAYRADVAVRSGMLKKSIKLKVKLYRNSEVAIALVGVDRNVIGEFHGEKVWPNKYQHLVELGVRPHSLNGKTKYRTNKRGNVVAVLHREAIHPGFEGRHYLQHAQENSGAAALDAANTKLKEVLEAEAEKLANK